VLLLHGGPGLSFNCLDDLFEELLPGYRVAMYQQRSLPPSTTEGPFTVERHVTDLISVLDALEWRRAFVIGHSWGGYLMLAAAAKHPGRFIAALGVDSIGAVGDGGIADFEKAMLDRTPEDSRARADELDHRAMAGLGTEEEALEAMRLIWPAYFSSPEKAPPMPEVRTSVEGYSEALDSMLAGMGALAVALPTVPVPILFLYGTESPIPATASLDIAAAMPYAQAQAIEGAGHFPWIERPGVVRAALDGLVERESV
jgi:pimeloyl-ACP methyl ester carboxylesterase